MDRAHQPESNTEFFFDSEGTFRRICSGTGDGSEPEQPGWRDGLEVERRRRRDAMEVEMKIRGLMMDPVTQMPIVVLKDVQGQTVLPIWVGAYEANAIALEIEKVQTPRPMTHDLLRNLIIELGVQVERVVVTSL